MCYGTSLFVPDLSSMGCIFLRAFLSLVRSCFTNFRVVARTAHIQTLFPWNPTRIHRTAMYAYVQHTSYSQGNIKETFQRGRCRLTRCMHRRALVAIVIAIVRSFEALHHIRIAMRELDRGANGISSRGVSNRPPAVSAPFSPLFFLAPCFTASINSFPDAFCLEHRHRKNRRELLVNLSARTVSPRLFQLYFLRTIDFSSRFCILKFVLICDRNNF